MQQACKLSQRAAASPAQHRTAAPPLSNMFLLEGQSSVACGSSTLCSHDAVLQSLLVGRSLDNFFLAESLH